MRGKIIKPILGNACLLGLLFLMSCGITRRNNEQTDFEILNYDLEDIDTLVDIGCGSAQMDRKISHKYPQLHFILEDIPFDIWKNDLKKLLPLQVQNSSYAPNFATNSRIVFGSPDSIPLSSGQYKRVLCRISLHEFTEREKMIEELSRILHPNGTLVVVEHIALIKGERDKWCKQLYLTKQEVIESFKSLQLIDTLSIPYSKGKSYIFKFQKKSSLTTNS